MQIKTVVLYRGNDCRTLDFKLGQINIVTGWSRTGKSSLLDIVEYCLGRRRPSFARGALDAVDWYGLLLEHMGSTLFVARPAPSVSAVSPTSVMVKRGAKTVARPDELAPTGDIDGLRNTLGGLLGIEGDVALAQRGHENQRPTAGQALLFCFLKQTEIPNPDQLFHRMGEAEVTRSIRESLPYFLGAVGSEHVARRYRLLQIRRDLHKIEQELDEIRTVEGQGEFRVASLVQEAQAAGLPLDAATRKGLENSLAETEPLDQPDGPDDPALGRRLSLRATRLQKTEELREVQRQRLLLYGFRQGQTGYKKEIAEQKARLASIGLIGQVEDGTACPVCGNPVAAADPTTLELRTHLSHLDSLLADEQTLEPVRLKKSGDLRKRTMILRGEIAALREAEAALGADETATAHYLAGERRAYVRGRISQFLESTSASETNRVALLERRQVDLGREADRLQAQIDPQAVARAVETKLSFVNEQMTEWAKRLRLEHSSKGIEFDLTDVTLSARDPQSPIPLAQIGSASNQVPYHIVALLAFHSWFARQQMPVPGFLFLDQPEQAYYPDDMPKGFKELNDRLTQDQHAEVRSLYQFMRDETAGLEGRLQTIVVGHWNPSDVDWFEDARIANWRGEGLVPANWIEGSTPHSL